jgi:alanyl-tRNA synthetase
MAFKTRQELINAYIQFFQKHKHREIPSSSLIPTNDPTVLFTTAGMHPLVPYLLGQKHPLGKRIVNVQKCIRTNDIEEVGNTTHHTFFEMLGNWSFGDYFKKEAIEFSFEFLTKTLKIPLNKLAVTCFAGDKDAPKDEEAANAWKALGIPKERIAFLPKNNNWWGPAGESGPCGPDTEMFFYKSKKAPKKFNPDDENWVEIWNDVFMQYVKDKRLILVDGMHCLYDKDFKLNKELLELINSLNTHSILVVNNFREKGSNLVKSQSPGRDTNWEAFSLEEKGIKKDNQEYFKILLKKFNLVPKEIMYFDHDKNNIQTAEKLGILSNHYTDIKSTKKFIEDNLFAFIQAKQKNVDTGMGVERTLSMLNSLDDDYQTSLFQPIITEIEKLSGKKYGKKKSDTRAMRIIADHIKASTFILGDEKAIKPSNIGQGYVLRRLIRRAIRYSKLLGIKENFTAKVAKSVLPIYPDYQELHRNHKFITEQLDEEEARFSQTLEKGMKKFSEIATDKLISGKEAFLLFQSYGFPIEMTQELADEKGIKIDLDEYNEEFKRHQEISRTAAAGAFKSGLADDSEMTRKLHTATHLLNESLRQVLKDKNIKQRGSNITPERLRFDFSFPRKLASDELKKIESLVNEKIKQSLPVTMEEIPLSDAIKGGAQAEFGAKYPELVSVYSIGDFSKEICTGPHVNNTKQLGKFKIIREESVAAGIRRIKAVLE